MEKITRAQQAEITRNKLFDAAYSLLEENDFASITIKDMVKRAGVSTGTFYLYFKSKLDVYYQTYRLADEYFANKVAPALNKATAKENLLVFFDRYAYYNAEHTGLRLTKLLYNSGNKYFLRETEPGMLSVLRGVAEHGLASGELDKAMDAGAIVGFLMNAARGLVYDWCIRDGGFELGESMREYITRLYRAISCRV